MTYRCQDERWTMGAWVFCNQPAVWWDWYHEKELCAEHGGPTLTPIAELEQTEALATILRITTILNTCLVIQRHGDEREREGRREGRDAIISYLTSEIDTLARERDAESDGEKRGDLWLMMRLLGAHASRINNEKHAGARAGQSGEGGAHG